MSKDELRDAILNQSKLFIQAGFSSTFVTRALNTPASDLWKPTVAELYEAKAITGVSDGTQFAASGYGDVTKESVAESLAKGVPLLRAIKERLPKVYQEIVEARYQSYLAGDTEAAQTALLRDQILPIISRLMPMADDSVLVDVAKLHADSYDALSLKNATTCYLYASGTDPKRSYNDDLGSALLKRELDLNERIVRTAQSRTPTSPDAVAAAWAKLSKLTGTYRLTDDDLTLLTTSSLSPSRHRDYCLASIKFYRAVAALPQREAAIVMREMLKQR